MRIYAPNRYVKNQVQAAYLDRISELLDQLGDPANPLGVDLDIGGTSETADGPAPIRSDGSGGIVEKQSASGAMNSEFTFGTFVEGKSNEMAKAAASQVAQNAGQSYNPLLLYGGVGLGKTHLMQAVGNEVKIANPDAKVVYLHSQRFVQDMVKALRQGTMADFMAYYRSVDMLLIDDIQFFAKKLRSQEEFFHVFNGLLERGRQMVLTCDRYPREIDGLEERLKSRFVWGLTVEVEPPELETRVAILMKKAEAEQVRPGSGRGVFHRREDPLECAGTGRGAAQGHCQRTIHRQPHHVSIRSSARCRDLLAIQDRQVGSTTSSGRSPSITTSRFPIFCLSDVTGPLPGLDRWRWRWRRNSRTILCRKLAMHLAARSHDRVARLPQDCGAQGKQCGCF